MKVLRKTILAILFALLLIQILILVKSQTEFKLGTFRTVSLTAAAAGLYYFVFEYKKKKK